MAKIEKEGGSWPYFRVLEYLNGENDDTGNIDKRLHGVWPIVGPSIIYEKEDKYKRPLDIVACDQMFSTDVIAYDVLSAIIKKNATADTIKVRQLHDGAFNTQKTSDIQKVMGEVTNPELVVHAGSNFVVILANNAKYGLDVWVWDLRTC